MQKSFKSGGRDCWGRTPSGFPLLQCGELGGHASANESGDCVGLAQIIGFPPSLETENNRSRSLLGHGSFVSPGKESFKRRSRNRLRRGLPDFPGLESAEFDWQSGGNQSLDRLRLTEFVQGSPCFQFGDYGREVAVSGHRRSMMPIAQNAGNSQSQKFCGTALLSPIYNKVRYIFAAHIGSGEHKEAQKRTGQYPQKIGRNGNRGHGGQGTIYNGIDAMMSMT
jgi:hypothetical protein